MKFLRGSLVGLIFVSYLLVPVISLSAQTLNVPGGTVGNIGGSNIGVGTTNPVSVLANTATNRTAAADGAGVAAGGFTWTTSEGYVMNLNNTGTGGSSNGLLVHTAASSAYSYALAVESNSTTRFAVRADGNVGIGTPTPAFLLDVNGEIRSTVTGGSNLLLSKANGSSIAFDNNAGTTTALIEANNGPGLEFWTNTVSGSGIVNRMVIDNAGRVGIGTVSPSTKLEIGGTTEIPALGTTGGTFSIQREDNAVGLDAGLNGAGNGWMQVQRSDMAAAYNLLLQPLGGNVGIGTANPSQKLSVNGTIRAKEVIVDTGWSDYVFAKTYRLAPLSEVEQAIEKDGHLPGIPSAKEVAEHGIPVGEMQSKLLAKIEELTLHQIALEKENHDLRTRMTALEQR